MTKLLTKLYSLQVTRNVYPMGVAITVPLVTESECSAAPAFEGSCNSARILVSCLVETFDVFMPFPGEECSLAFFEDMSVSVLHNSSQNDLF